MQAPVGEVSKLVVIADREPASQKREGADMAAVLRGDRQEIVLAKISLLSPRMDNAGWWRV